MITTPHGTARDNRRPIQEWYRWVYDDGAPSLVRALARLRRRALDLTQGALARAAGCSVVTVRKLESDERRPSRRIVERLADALQVAPHERASLIALARPGSEAAEQRLPAEQPP